MNTHLRIHSAPAAIVALFTLLLFAPSSFAESDAIPTMARIVVELNHFPSAEQKEALAAIKQNENNSEATQVIADAIFNIEHKAKPEDVVALKELAGNASVSEAEKQLAMIVMEINHVASPEAKQKLETLAQHKK